MLIFKSSDMVEDLVEFHERFGLEYNGPPRSLPLAHARFRYTCLREEVEEYIASYGNVAKELDALIDLIYFALGCAYLQGLAPVFNEAWTRVHEANMLKMRSPATDESAARGSAFDVVKPPGWTPPDLTDLVQR